MIRTILFPGKDIFECKRLNANHIPSISIRATIVWMIWVLKDAFDDKWVFYICYLEKDNGTMGHHTGKPL